MSRWQSFLTSLAIPGGNILILCFFSLILLAMVLYSGNHANQQIVTFILTSASTFLGALVGILRGRSTDPVGGGSSSTSTTTVSTPADLPKP
jgi:hypothetical protein